MKKIMLGILFSGLTVCVGYGQNVSDPTYSPSNYKHYNKAVEAERSVLMNDRKNKGTVSTGKLDQNYKAQNNQPEVIQVVSIPSYYTSSSNVTKNYKQQFEPTGKGLRD